MNHIAWTKRKAAIALTLITIITVSSAMFLQNNQTSQAALINPHPGLVGWWRFDEGTGTVASDNSGNGKDGTVNGASWVNGKYGNALSFDGTTNDYVSIPSMGIASGPFSISFWVNPQNINNYGTAIGYDYNRRIMIRADGNLLTQFDGNFFSTGKVTNNAWSFVVYAFDGTNEYWYINGVFDSKHATTLPTWNAPFYVGQYDRVNYPFKGVIDEVQVYNRNLSAVEIQAGSQISPEISSNLQIKLPIGTTQVITTISWQGTSSINATIISPSQTYPESTLPVYQKTTYSTSGSISSMLNIKRLSVSVNALLSDQIWNVTLTFDNPVPYQLTVEVQK